MTDVSTTCAVVIFRVKVNCITSVEGIILWLLIWLVNCVNTVASARFVTNPQKIFSSVNRPWLRRTNETNRPVIHSSRVCSGCPCRYQLAVTNGANREASLTNRYPLLTGRLVLAFWQFVCLCIWDMCGSVSVKRDKYISLSVGFRAQNNNRSTDNVWSGLPLVRTKFRFARHFDYPGYQRFFLVCDGELRFVGRRPTRVRPKARAAELTF